MLGDDTARPGELVLVGSEGAVDDLDLTRVDASLAAQAERAGAAALPLQALGVVEREVDVVEGRADSRRDSRGVRRSHLTRAFLREILGS